MTANTMYRPRPPLWSFGLRRRYPVVRQYDRADCGPACLLSVLRYWGGNASMVHVREITGTDAQGTTLLALSEGARALGIEARGASGTYEELRQESLPCIAHVVIEERRHHYVVVYEMDAERVLIGDPGAGLVRLSRAEFERIWVSNIVLLLERRAELHRSNPPHWFRWIAQHFGREATWVYQSLFLGAIYTVLGLLTALFVQWLIDRFIPSGDTGKILLTGTFLLAIQLVRAGAGLLRQRFMLVLNKRVNLALAEEFLTRVFCLPTRFFETRKRGDIMARLNDSATIQSAMLRLFGTSAIDALVIIGSLAFIFVLAPPVGWLAVSALPVYAAVLVLAARRLRFQQNDVMRAYAQLEASYVDTLEGIETIRAFNASGAVSRLNKFLFGNYQHRTEQLGVTQAKLSASAEAVGGLLVIGALIYGASLVVSEQLLLGEMIAAYSLLAGILPSMARLVDATVAVQAASVAAHRLLDLLLVMPEANTGAQTFSLDHELRIEAGTFAWPKGGVLFEGANLAVRRGRLTGLCGASGSGKSTLVKIIERKYALSSGSLRVDGTDAQTIDMASYRENVIVIPESAKIFNGTIAENLALGTDWDYATLERRIHEIGFSQFMTRFPAGLLTLVGEDGHSLSSGERQLIAFMRALLRNPAVLIVDEGINTLDAQIAAFVLQKLRAYAADHAVLIISHARDVLAGVEDLYVLNENTIVRMDARLTNSVENNQSKHEQMEVAGHVRT